MAEYKKMWAKAFKDARKRQGLNRLDFAQECLGIYDVKKYNVIEDGKAAPSNYMKYKLENL